MDSAHFTIRAERIANFPTPLLYGNDSTTKVITNGFEWKLHKAHDAINLTSDPQPSGHNNYLCELRFYRDPKSITWVSVQNYNGPAYYFLVPLNLKFKTVAQSQNTLQELEAYNQVGFGVHRYASHFDFAGYRFTCTVHNYIDPQDIWEEVNEFVRDDVIGHGGGNQAAMGLAGAYWIRG